MTEQKLPRAPQGLSKSARVVWDALHSANVFELHEELAVERWFIWQDLADRLLAEAATLRGRERSGRLRSAADADAMALKFRRTVKFEDPAHPARKPGRPPGWATRRAAAQIRSLSGEA